MGLWDQFKKGKMQCVKTENHEGHALLEIVKIISFSHEELLKSARNCIENTLEYYQNHLDDYEERGISDQEELSFLQWVGCIDLLKHYGFVCECDWKESAEEYLSQISALKGMGSFRLTTNCKWLDEGQDIPRWCEKLEQKWRKSNCVIGAFDLDSDSYAMFIGKKEDLETLSVLAKKLGYRIDYAKNM